DSKGLCASFSITKLSGARQGCKPATNWQGCDEFFILHLARRLPGRSLGAFEVGSMKLRKWKIALLVASSGVGLQLGSCIAQLVFTQLYSSALKFILDSLLGNNNGSDTGTTP